MSDPYRELVEVRSRPSLPSINVVCQLLADNKWETASPELENKECFKWRSPKDPGRINKEHRLEQRLIEKVRTVVLPGARGGLSTVTFLAAAFPVGSGKRGQIDLLGVSNTGGVVMVELKHGSNDDWCAVVETAEYLLRLRANYVRVKGWMKDKCGVIVGDPKFSRGLAVLPRGLRQKKSKECDLALTLASTLLDKMKLNIELYEMDYDGYDRARLPQIHRLTIWDRIGA